jgi:hypothetical protein
MPAVTAAGNRRGGAGKKGRYHDNACALAQANKAATGDVATRCAK